MFIVIFARNLIVFNSIDMYKGDPKTTAFRGFKRRKWPLKVSPVSVVLQLLVPRTTSTKSVISSVKIEAGQSTNSKTYPGCPGAQFSAFWILKSGRKVCAQTFHRGSKGSSRSSLNENPRTVFARFSSLGLHPVL